MLEASKRAAIPSIVQRKLNLEAHFVDTADLSWKGEVKRVWHSRRLTNGPNSLVESILAGPISALNLRRASGSGNYPQRGGAVEKETPLSSAREHA
jgi:hypothetical protein